MPRHYIQVSGISQLPGGETQRRLITLDRSPHLISGAHVNNMSVKYWVDDQTLVFCQSWEGYISASEVLEFRAVAKTFLANDSLVDLTNVTGSDITSDSLRVFAEDPSNRGRIAIIAPKPALFGMARMYESLASLQARPTRIGVFWTKEEAMSWLREGGLFPEPAKFMASE